MKKVFAIVAIALLTSSCAFPGGEKPRNVNEELVLAVKTHDGMVKSVSTALDLQTITPVQGRQVFNALAQARVGIDAARTSTGGCVDSKTGTKVTDIPGVVAPTAPPAPGQIPMLLIQTIRCSPTTTALDQIALANTFLTRLAIYYQSQGAKP